jgi:hypothetical protein
MLWTRVLPTLDAFDEAGIEFVLLKGVSLLSAFGDDWGARPMFDVDVLVRPGRLDHALDLLEEVGWRPAEGLTVEWVRSRSASASHSIGFEHDNGGRLDLHWHVLWESVGCRADDAFWHRAVTTEIDGRHVRVLHPADTLLHMLVHGVTGDNAPPVQWVADAVLVGRRAVAGASHDELAELLGAQARSHGELRTAIETLGVIHELVDDEWVRPLIERLARQRPTIAERMRRRPDSDHPLDQALRGLARYAAGGTGFARGAAALVKDRLQLELTAHPTAATLYAASGRASVVGRLARHLLGSFVRPAALPATPLDGYAVLDFSDPSVLDRFGATGWALSEPEGATTRGAEARLVLPLGPGLQGSDVVITFEMAARAPATRVDIRANERLVGRAVLGPEPAEVVVTVPQSRARCFTPLEVSLRRRSAPWRPGALGVTLRRLALRRADAPRQRSLAPAGGPVR